LSREKFDVIIIGTGQGGGPLSTAFGRAGRRVAIVERGDVGGTCINTGCTPTKTMVASARVAHLARREGREIKVAKMPMSSVARALEVDEPRGLLKVIVDAGSGQILGCAMLGIEGGELMGMLEIAMMGKLTAADLRDGVYAHPTLAEAMNNLFGSI
jgi:pyruvate/2-oxoglutarate dehydrogenase complex dihydrolipoamide dehydrogenase (E3) component